MCEYIYICVESRKEEKKNLENMTVGAPFEI